MNINNQTEYKKPFGTRLFILITVCMIVLAMVVPAFASEFSEWPIDLVDQREQYWYYVVSEVYSDDVLTGHIVFALGNDGPWIFNGSDFLIASTGQGIQFRSYQVALGASSWGNYTSGLIPPSFVVGNIVYSDYIIYDSEGVQIFPVIPPDLGQEVSGVLPTVLSWIQQTLNALFVEGGALQGLLLLVAVPVAITLLLLGARFIRSVIWGA